MKEFGALEAAIMDVLWDAEAPLAVRDIRAGLDYGREVAYTTVMTVTTILFHKGLLDREKNGRAWIYRAVEDRAAHSARLMREVLGAGRDRSAVLLRFVEALGANDRERLARLLGDPAAAPGRYRPRPARLSCGVCTNP